MLSFILALLTAFTLANAELSTPAVVPACSNDATATQSAYPCDAIYVGDVPEVATADSESGLELYV